MLYKISAQKMLKYEVDNECNPLEKEGYGFLSRKRSPSEKAKMRLSIGTRGHSGFRISTRTKRIG